MKFAFCLAKYFPFGGLQRDFMKISKICHSHGHTIDVYTGLWQGEKPDHLNITVLPGRGLTNHSRRMSFIQQTIKHIRENITIPSSVSIKCRVLTSILQQTRVLQKKPFQDFFLPVDKTVPDVQAIGRCRISQAFKNPDSFNRRKQKNLYIKHYQTPENRFHPLPPGISKSRLLPENSEKIRRSLRNELGIGMHDNIVLMVGTGYWRKGVDRAIKAMAALPGELLSKTFLLTVGENKLGPFQKLAKRLSVLDHVRFMGGRKDVPRFLASSDLLLHPAYQENTGTVLIEAMASSLPVLVTDICGYADHIELAQAGELVPSPYRQETLNTLLAFMLTSEKKSQWRKNGLDYILKTDVFSLSEKAAEIIEKAAAC